MNAHHQPSAGQRLARALACGRVVAWWLSFRTDPYTPDEIAFLKEAPVEGKAIRRHRRKRRAVLLREGGQS
jgi:hypothetical protein